MLLFDLAEMPKSTGVVFWFLPIPSAKKLKHSVAQGGRGFVMERSVVVHVLVDAVNTGLGPLVAKRVVVQNIGTTVPFPHALPKSGFTLNPRVQGFLTSRPMPNRYHHVNASQSHARAWVPSVLFAM